MYFFKLNIFCVKAVCKPSRLRNPPDDGVGNDFRNIGKLVTDYTAVQPEILLIMLLGYQLSM